jgi:hypothetical protein
MMSVVCRWRITIKYTKTSVAKNGVTNVEPQTTEVYTDTNFAGEAIALASKLTVNGIISAIHVEKMDKFPFEQ